MNRILLLFVILTGCCAAQLYGQKVGTTSLQFLKVMPTARAAAMADAYVTLASGADAVFWNPAGLAMAPTQEISTTVTFWLFDTRQSALSYSLPLGDFGSVGLQLQYVDFGSIEETRVDQLGRMGTPGNDYYNPGLTGRTFSPKSYLVGISYARNLTTRFSTGVTVKYAAENLWNDSKVTVRIPGEAPGSFIEQTFNTNARVLLYDFGMRYNTGYRSVQIGAAVQNFGSQVQFAEEKFPAPLIFRLGTSAEVMGREALFTASERHRLTASFDLFQPNDYLQQMHLGVEYGFSDIFTLRSGYKFNYDADGLTFGAGVASAMSGFTFAFDYSFGDMGQYLPKVHRLSLGVKIH